MYTAERAGHYATETLAVSAGRLVGYGRLVRTGLEHVRGALEAGSTEPLTSAP